MQPIPACPDTAASLASEQFLIHVRLRYGEPIAMYAMINCSRIQMMKVPGHPPYNSIVVVADRGWDSMTIKLL